MLHNLFISLVFIFSIFISACDGPTGYLTIVNGTAKPVAIRFHGKKISLEPENHINEKGIKVGHHKMKIGDKETLEFEISANLTTLIDVSADNCFIVTDYSNQYDKGGDGKVKIIEKFFNKKVFTTTVAINANIGEHLPEVVHHNKKITRLQQVDCTWIDNDKAIIDSISNLP